MDIIQIPRAKFILLNNRFSAQYKAERDMEKKAEIIWNLYELNLPSFKAWNIFGREDREDFKQEAYFWILRALETFKDGKGSFVSWLKYYILKAWKYEQTKHDKSKDHVELIGIEEKKARLPDYLFWNKLRKSFTPDEWICFKALILQKKTLKQLKQSSKHKNGYWSQVKSNVFNKIKLLSLTSSHKCNTYYDNYSSEQWLKMSEISKKLGMTYPYFRRVISPNGDTPLRVDPRDVLRVPLIRIRYLSQADGLVFPRFRARLKHAAHTS